MAGKSMREWFEVMQEHRRKALSEQYDVFQRALAESCDKIERLRHVTWKAVGSPINWPSSTNVQNVSHETPDGIAAQLAYGEQCADTDGLALARLPEDGARFPNGQFIWSADLIAQTYQALTTPARDTTDDAVTISRREYRELQNKATALAEIRAEYDIAKRCLEARIRDLEAQAVKLTRERNNALTQTSARHGVQREAATGASGPCETPRANPFAGGWATSWSMR